MAGTPELALRRLRRDRGWSLRTLAERSGVSAAMLSEIERGAKSPTVRLAYQIARALDCSISALLGDGPDRSGGAPPGPAGPGEAPAADPRASGPAAAPHAVAGPVAGSGASPGAPGVPAPRPGRVLAEPGGGVRRESHAGPLLHGRLEVVVYDLAPGASTGPMAPNRAGTVEQVVALAGTVEVVLDGVPVRVAAGESAAHGVHATEYRNPGAAEPCRFLVLVDTTRC